MNILFCVPGGGASSVMYMEWRRKLKEDFEVIPLEIPGRGRAQDKECLETIEETAELLSDEICEKAKDRGYSIFGYCYGGIIAYEICRILNAKGLREPEEVFVCGSVAPQGGKGITPLLSRREERSELKNMLSRFFPPYLTTDTEELDRICSKYMEALFKKYDDNGSIMPVFSEDLDDSCEAAAEGNIEADDKLLEYALSFANSFFRCYGRDETALIKYLSSSRPRFVLNSRLTVICGHEDEITGDCGALWQSCAGAPAEIRYIDGNHFSLIEDLDVISHIIKGGEKDSVAESLEVIWRKVLNAGDDLKINDDTNFFEIGGNSLLIGIMNILIEKELGRKLKVETFFQKQTFSGMVDAVKASL